MNSILTSWTPYILFIAYTMNVVIQSSFHIDAWLWKRERSVRHWDCHTWLQFLCIAPFFSSVAYTYSIYVAQWGADRVNRIWMRSCVNCTPDGNRDNNKQHHNTCILSSATLLSISYCNESDNMTIVYDRTLLWSTISPHIKAEEGFRTLPESSS